MTETGGLNFSLDNPYYGQVPAYLDDETPYSHQNIPVPETLGDLVPQEVSGIESTEMLEAERTASLMEIMENRERQFSLVSIFTLPPRLDSSYLQDNRPVTPCVLPDTAGLRTLFRKFR